jgi:hypothetical protein
MKMSPAIVEQVELIRLEGQPIGGKFKAATTVLLRGASAGFELQL